MRVPVRRRRNVISRNCCRAVMWLRGNKTSQKCRCKLNEGLNQLDPNSNSNTNLSNKRRIKISNRRIININHHKAPLATWITIWRFVSNNPSNSSNYHTKHSNSTHSISRSNNSNYLGAVSSNSISHSTKINRRNNGVVIIIYWRRVIRLTHGLSSHLKSINLRLAISMFLVRFIIHLRLFLIKECRIVKSNHQRRKNIL